jgi:hypothetical protein
MWCWIVDRVDEGDLEYLLKRLLDEAEIGLLKPNWWLMTMMIIMYEKKNVTEKEKE